MTNGNLLTLVSGLLRAQTGAQLAGCMLSKSSLSVCVVLNGVVIADAVGCRAEAAVMLSGGSLD